MNYQIVSDSSSNLFAMAGVDYTAVPLKINAGDREYVDTPDLDLEGMIRDLKAYKGKSGSSCPNTQEWLDAFHCDRVYGVTITKNLSGSYNAARNAAQEYAEEHPGAQAFVFDSLSAGPQLVMMAEKIVELENAGASFDDVVAGVQEYQNHLHTAFCLESLTNLARNGRVNPAVAKIAGALGIRMVGMALGGTIVPVTKPRGMKKTFQAMLQLLQDRGFRDGGYVRISHCFAEQEARTLAGEILNRYIHARIVVEHTAALCSFYAEEGGYIVSFEGDYNAENDCTKF